MRVADQALGWFLILLGCIHNFVAAPMTYAELSTQALWFASAGLALWYAGFLNLLRVRSLQPSRLLVAFCLLTNLSLLAFVVSYALTQGTWAAPESVALIGAVVVLTVRSALTAFGRGQTKAQSES